MKKKLWAVRKLKTKKREKTANANKMLPDHKNITPQSTRKGVGLL